MDIYDYLKMDHKKVTKLFELFKTSETQRNKLEIFEMIKHELLVHAESEEYVFYKALEINTDSQKKVLHSEKEHVEIKNMLEDISKLTVVDQHFEKQMLKLKRLVEHHVSEEEGAVFSAAKKVLTENDALILKEKMHDRKEKIRNAFILDADELDKVEKV